MTDLREAPDAVFVVPPEAPRGSRRRRRTTWAIVALTAAVVAAVAAWVLVPGAIAVGQTRVLLDAAPFTCARASDVTTLVDDGPLGDPDRREVLPAVRMHPGLDCTMAVVVQNDGDADVDVDSITIPLAGPENGWGVHADHGLQQGLSPSGDAHAVDAVFDYRDDPRSGGSFEVAAHSRQRFTFHLSWSGGCMPDGSDGISTDAPTAVIAAGPWHVAKSWAGSGYAFLGGSSADSARCRR